MISKKIVPLFYTIMNYPAPLATKQFLYIDEIKEIQTEIKEIHEQSWENIGEQLKDYLSHIHNQSWLFESIPFVRQIYLCNSITFNALHEESDIDIYIVTYHNYIRLARFRSVLLFWFANLKRNKKDKKMKFCLSFYSDEKSCNLYHLRNTRGDKYLSYRVAHCVLLYTDDTLNDNYIWQQNKELLEFLPNHPQKQAIFLDSIIHRNNRLFKKVIIWLSDNAIGKAIQLGIRTIRKTILIFKVSQLKSYTKKNIIISDNMLKFHDDQRDLFEFRQKSAMRKGKQSDNHRIAV